MKGNDVKLIFQHCFDNDKSCRIAIKLKSGEIYETNAGDCFLTDEMIRFPTKDERGKVFYNVDIKSLEYIKTYNEEWTFSKRSLKYKMDITIIPELWEAMMNKIFMNECNNYFKHGFCNGSIIIDELTDKIQYLFDNSYHVDVIIENGRIKFTVNKTLTDSDIGLIKTFISCNTLKKLKDS